MIRTALIGYGYWGPNLARNVSASHQMDLVVVCDASQDRQKQAKTQFPSVATTDDVVTAITNFDIDAVLIATPVNTHFPIAKACLEANKHVFVEKPICASVTEADELISLAKSRNLVIHVDHTFLYTSSVRHLQKELTSGSLGDLLYFDSVRVNLGLFQHDVNVVWDLAVHDVSILNFVVQRLPIAVSATGTNHPQSDKVSAAFITLFYPGHFIAHIHVSWMSPVKIRRTMLSGTKKMLVYDDLETVEKIKVYDSTIQFEEDIESRRKALVSYRLGDMHSPRLVESEALQGSLADFCEAILCKTISTSDGVFGRNTISILEAVEKSMSESGRRVEIVF